MTQKEQTTPGYTIIATKWFCNGTIGIILVEAADVPEAYKPQYRAYIGYSPEEGGETKIREIVSNGTKLTYQEATALFPHCIKSPIQYVI